MTRPKLHIRKGDNVLILSGKDKGKKGKVIKVRPKDGKVIVEGVNIVKKHARPTPKVPQGGIREMEAPIHCSNAMVICPACHQPTRVSRRVDAEGIRRRTCKKCGEDIDK